MKLKTIKQSIRVSTDREHILRVKESTRTSNTHLHSKPRLQTINESIDKSVLKN